MDLKSFKKTKIPDKPGVYFFLGTPKRSEGGLKGNQPSHEAMARQRGILYIGKATSLKDRVRSYFGKDLIETRGPLLVDLVFKADKIKWQETDSVLEALILEATLIKKYQPKYNTKEKSDKSFNYVCITKDKKISVVREKVLNKKKLDSFFGPFPNGNQLREGLKIIRKIFPFFDERKEVKGKNEFYKQIKLIPENSIENKNNIKNIKLFFRGKKQKILKDLEKEMKIFAKNKEFEKAGEIKRQLFALKHINDVALIKESREYINFSFLRPSLGALRGTKWDPREQKINILSAFRIESYDIAHMSGKNMVGVMVVMENGELNKNEYRKFKIKTQDKANDIGALKEVLERRFVHKEWAYPNLIVVDGGIAQMNATHKAMARLNLDIKVASVAKDEKHKPKSISGDVDIIKKYKREILLTNSEAHRFAITYHKKLRNKNFIK